VRDGLFGDSIQFLISGGSHISAETLAFFNGIGYHLANGYGMTELGITSVEFSDKRKILNTASIGAPFHTTEYRVSGDGELLVKSKTRAARITQGDTTIETDFDAWFATGDLAEEKGGRYFIKGRRDDLLIGPDGENINPVLAESGIAVKGVEQVCLFKAITGEITLLASLRSGYSAEGLRAIHAELTGALSAVKLERAVNRVLMTYEPLLRGGEIKLSRSRIAKAVASGEIVTFDASGIDRRVEERLSGLEAEVRACFAAALDRPANEIPADAHFFNELGGTSLEYFALQSEIKTRFGIEELYADGTPLFTVKDFTAYIRNH
jgi:acyl-coenzyme A synthetase/AMP-(fatty) acid ligase/acyl carrier protein